MKETFIERDFYTENYTKFQEVTCEQGLWTVNSLYMFIVFFVDNKTP